MYCDLLDFLHHINFTYIEEKRGTYRSFKYAKITLHKELQLKNGKIFGESTFPFLLCTPQMLVTSCPFDWWWSYFDNFGHFGHSRLQSLTNMWSKALCSEQNTFVRKLTYSILNSQYIWQIQRHALPIHVFQTAQTHLKGRTPRDHSRELVLDEHQVFDVKWF